jgi:hypothetical protein
MSDKAVADSLVVHPGQSAGMLKMYFTEPVTFGFLMSGRSVPEVGRSELGP